MRKIGLIAQGGAGWMGGSEYIRNLLRALAAADASQPTLFCFGDDQDHWRDAGASLAPVRPMWHAPLVDRLGLNNRQFAAALRRHPVEFLYPLTYGNRENIGLTFPLRRTLGDTRWAGWIPDFQHRHLPRFFTPAQAAHRDRGISALLAEAPAVVMSSGSAAEDLRAFYPGYRGRVKVLRFATCPRPEWYEPFDAPELPERFFAVCNQFWLHKNHLTVFRALALLAARGIRPVVLCTGALDEARDSSYPDQVRSALHENGIADHVRLLGLLPRRSQIEMLRRCVAVIQPSLFEGWSTVVEDARALGRPVLLSDIPVHREQAPPGARYFSAESAEALAELLADAWADWPAGPGLAAEQAARAAAEARLVEVGRRFLEIAAHP
ncbi:MAG: glycosyltransferase family 1 protein [Chthoniobacteraceae bacterium]